MSGKNFIVSILFVFFATIGMEAQNHSFQPELGSSIYFNNRYIFEVPGEAIFMLKPAESFFIGFSYQRKLTNLLFFKTGFYHTSISQRYTLRYNWILSETNSQIDISRGNFWIQGMACFKLPLAIGIQIPLNRMQSHTIETSVGINTAFVFFNAAGESGSYLNEDYSKETYVFNYYRETTFPLQLFADIRFTYRFTTPKNRNWIFFVDFNPEITRNTIYTEITLMPDSPTQKTWTPFISNHHINLGVGYRFVRRNR